MRQPVCPELEDVQLHLTILIANGLVGNALSYLRRSRNQQNRVQLMHHLLSGCQEMLINVTRGQAVNNVNIHE